MLRELWRLISFHVSWCLGRLGRLIGPLTLVHAAEQGGLPVSFCRLVLLRIAFLIKIVTEKGRERERNKIISIQWQKKLLMALLNKDVRQAKKKRKRKRAMLVACYLILNFRLPAKIQAVTTVSRLRLSQVFQHSIYSFLTSPCLWKGNVANKQRHKSWSVSWKTGETKHLLTGISESSRQSFLLYLESLN